MSRDRIERRLKGVSTRLKRLRTDLSIADEQLAHLVDDADDARLRALVSETPGAGKEHRSADRHAEAMRAHRDGLAEEIAQLESQLDELLDAMGAA
jgi:chromosome segregation ATPase